MAASILSLREKAKTNLVAFRHLLLENSADEVLPADFHYDWSAGVLDGSGHEVWEAFRESAKSQLILRSFPNYQLVFPQERFDYILIIKNNATLASAKLKEIANEYLQNQIANSNLVKIMQQSGNVFHVQHRNEAGEIVETRIEGYGKGASVRGALYKDKRPKICIIDDPQDAEDAKSEVVMEADWNWFLGDVLFLGQNTRIFLIGNNLGDRCIVERVMYNAKLLNFKAHRTPIEVAGKPTWPEKYSIKFIQDEKDAFREMGKLDVWLRERMCQSTDEETKVFHEKDYRHFNPQLVDRIVSDCKVAARLDPATSKESTACFRAIVVNAVDSDGNWFVVDVPYGRWDPTELIDNVFDTVVKWKLKSFGIEKGMLKDVFEHFIFKEMARRKIFFDIIPIEHAKAGAKLDRIKMLAPRFKAHTIWFPDEAPWLSELKSELAGVTNDGIKSLFIDLVDALAMHQQKEEKPFGRTASRNLPRRGKTNAGVL